MRKLTFLVVICVMAVANIQAAENMPPIVDAGEDQTIFWSDGVQLYGSAVDDGLPSPPGFISYLWEVDLSPAESIVDFSSIYMPNPFVTFSMPGVYTLSFNVSDTEYITSDQVVINATPEPATLLLLGLGGLMLRKKRSSK